MKNKRLPKTIKERKWAKRTLETGDGTLAATEVYDVSSHKSAKSIASQNFSKLTLVPLMEAEGITDKKLIQVLDEGLGASKTVSARVITKKGSLVDADERTDDFIDVPDYDVRHKYMKTAFELKGHLNDRGNTNVQVNVNNTIEVPPQDLDSFIKWRDEQRRARIQKPASDSTK